MSDFDEREPSRPAGVSRRTDKAYAALFGRFTGTSEASPPANEVLVGREGQRAYLVDLLIGMGRRGSYLITGRRGAGKTCFVQQCISEYEASVFKRFLRASVGRGIWDRVAVVLVWLLLILGALMLSEVALLLMQMTQKRVVLLWFLLVPIAVILHYPAIYAKELCVLAASVCGTEFLMLASSWRRRRRAIDERVGV
jgi:hypothetical protein